MPSLTTGAFDPHLSVTLGGTSALVSTGVLIYFIHHISRSIQADVLVGRIGEEVVDEGEDLYPGRFGGQITDQIAAHVNSTFLLSNQRTPEQDVEFAVNQLDEIAVRALSPSLNDPFTAIRCVDRLGSAFCRPASRFRIRSEQSTCRCRTGLRSRMCCRTSRIVQLSYASTESVNSADYVTLSISVFRLSIHSQNRG